MDSERYFTALKRYAEIDATASAAFEAVYRLNELWRGTQTEAAAMRQRIAEVKSTPQYRGSRHDQILTNRQLTKLGHELREIETRHAVYVELAEKQQPEAQRLGTLRQAAEPALKRARDEFFATNRESAE